MLNFVEVGIFLRALCGFVWKLTICSSMYLLALADMPIFVVVL